MKRLIVIILFLFIGPINLWALTGSFSFDEVNDSVDTGPDYTDFDSDTMYFSFWMNSSGGPVNSIGVLVYTSTGGATFQSGFDRIILQKVNATNHLLFNSKTSGAAGTWVTPTNSLPNDTDLHILATYDRSNNVNDPTIWINCIEQTLVEQQTPTGNPLNDTTRIRAGSGAGTAGATVSEYKGLLSYVEYGTRLVTENECVDFMFYPGSFPDSERQLLWPFTKDKIGDELDLSGKGNKGNIYGVYKSENGPPIVFRRVD